MFLVQKYLPPSSFVPPFLVLEFVACFLENKPDEVTKRLPGVLDAKTQRCSLEKAQIIVRNLKLT
jgi:hypothetical protein